MTVFAQFTSSDDVCYDFIQSLFIYSLYDPCVMSTIFPSISIDYWILSTQTANEKLLCIPSGTPHFSEKQYTVMWQVLWLSPSPEQARPYVEASERKLQDVGFFGTSSKSRAEIEKFQRE